MARIAALEAPETVPLMSVQVEPVEPLTQSTLLMHLRELEEEDPLLSVRPEAEGVSVGVMGAVQIEVLQGVLASRFGDRGAYAAAARALQGDD